MTIIGGRSVNETGRRGGHITIRVAGAKRIIPLQGKCDEPLKVKPAPDPLHNPAQRALRILAIYPAELGSVTREAGKQLPVLGRQFEYMDLLRRYLIRNSRARPADQIAAKAAIYPVRHGKQNIFNIAVVAIVCGDRGSVICSSVSKSSIMSGRRPCVSSASARQRIASPFCQFYPLQRGQR